MRKSLKRAGLRDQTQKWWDFAGATVEQITERVFGNWGAKNLRGILRHPIGIIRDDPYNIMLDQLLALLLPHLALQKICAISTIP